MVVRRLLNWWTRSRSSVGVRELIVEGCSVVKVAKEEEVKRSEGAGGDGSGNRCGGV